MLLNRGPPPARGHTVEGLSRPCNSKRFKKASEGVRRQQEYTVESRTDQSRGHHRQIQETHRIVAQSGREPQRRPQMVRRRGFAPLVTGRPCGRGVRQGAKRKSKKAGAEIIVAPKNSAAEITPANRLRDPLQAPPDMMASLPSRQSAGPAPPRATLCPTPRSSPSPLTWSGDQGAKAAR